MSDDEIFRKALLQENYKLAESNINQQNKWSDTLPSAWAKWSRKGRSWGIQVEKVRIKAKKKSWKIFLLDLFTTNGSKIFCTTEPAQNQSVSFT